MRTRRPLFPFSQYRSLPASNELALRGAAPVRGAWMPILMVVALTPVVSPPAAVPPPPLGAPPPPVPADVPPVPAPPPAGAAPVPEPVAPVVPAGPDRPVVAPGAPPCSAA